MILYLHGFRSSPQSMKAQLTAEAMVARGWGDRIHIPQLPPSPAEAMALCHQLIEQHLGDKQVLTVIGSSLGGYYATYLAAYYDCQAVLINPAVYATRDLSTQLGHLTYFHDDRPFDWRLEQLHELHALVVPNGRELVRRHPERYQLYVGDRDEVLDWQEMVHRYPGARQVIVPGADHSFACYSDYLDNILAFAGYGQNKSTQ